MADDLNKRFGAAKVAEEAKSEGDQNCQTPKVEQHAPPAEQAPPPQEEQQQASEEEPTGPSEIVKAEMREINRAVESGGSLAVDQWRMKHHNRVAKKCGVIYSCKLELLYD